MPHLIVKWGREKLEVNADLNEAPLLLKSQLYAITGVLPERQKVLIKVNLFAFFYCFIVIILINYLYFRLDFFQYI